MSRRYRPMLDSYQCGLKYAQGGVQPRQVFMKVQKFQMEGTHLN